MHTLNSIQLLIFRSNLSVSQLQQSITGRNQKFSYDLRVSFSILLLWFNERRAAINSYRLQFARQHCISLTPFQESNPTDLIHITGQLMTDELITDKDFGVSQINCVKLHRYVEMYQWVKGDQKQYEQKWVDHHVENHFGYIDHIQYANYNNDKSKWVLKAQTFLNQCVKLHQFILEEDMMKELNTPLQNVKFNQANVQIVQQKYKDSGFSRFLLQDDYIYMHQVDDQIVNGDLRISFKQVICSDATIIARGDTNKLVVWQFEDTFNKTVARDYDAHERTCCNLPVPNDSKPIKDIYWVFQGLFTPEECFSKVVNENALLFWIFRSIGYILIAIGTIILLSPVSFLTDFIPTEKLTGLSFFIFGCIAAVPITIFSICFSWVYYRPKIGFLMLLIQIFIIIITQISLFGIQLIFILCYQNKNRQKFEDQLYLQFQEEAFFIMLTKINDQAQFWNRMIQILQYCNGETCNITNIKFILFSLLVLRWNPLL